MSRRVFPLNRLGRRSPKDPVDAAYVNILRRHADPSGYAHYADVAQKYLEKILRGSAEYRNLQSGESLKPRTRKNNDIPWPLSQVIVVRDLKLIYCPIAKVANTSMKRILVEMSEVESIADLAAKSNSDLHGLIDFTSTGLQFGDYSTEVIEEILSDPGYFRFALVRNPLDRILSAYWEKFVVARDDFGRHSYPVMCEIQDCTEEKIDFERGITFREFVEYLSGQDPVELDTHWRPQYLYLAGLRYDQIFPMERISKVLDELERRTGVKPSLRRDNISDSGVGEFVSGAADITTGELRKKGKVSRASFMDKEISEALEAYYSVDLLLYNFAVATN